MADDPFDRSLTDPNGDPNWQPLWGNDESMSYGDSIPTPQAALRAYFAVASTLKDLVDSAPRTQDGVQLGSKRAIRSLLLKLALLDSTATHRFYKVEKSNTPAEGIQTASYSPTFSDEASVAIIRQMTMLPLGSDWESEATLPTEQVDLFNRRFAALESLVIWSESESAKSKGDEADADYRPVGAFPRTMHACIRQAAQSKRKSKRVRKRKIDGSVEYSYVDVQHWWPEDLQNGLAAQRKSDSAQR